MRLSTETYTLSSRFGDEKAIHMFAEAGFDSLDYSMYNDAVNGPAFGSDYKQYAVKLRQIAADHGIGFNQAHAPFGFCFDDYQNPLLIAQTRRAIEFAARLGAPLIVVHPVNCREGIDQLAYNMDFYGQFDALCDDFGIQIAIENMWGYDRERRCSSAHAWMWAIACLYGSSRKRPFANWEKNDWARCTFMITISWETTICCPTAGKLTGTLFWELWQKSDTRAILHWRRCPGFRKFRMILYWKP